MSSETIIKVEHVSKEYRLGAIGGATLRGDLQSFFAKIRGKEDPNSKLGSKKHTGNQKFLALDDISFEVKKGERIGIIGHNGAGKSTFLKLLSRVTAPTKGTIKYNGRIASMLEVGTGFHPELTGRENVYMNGAILGMTKKEISKKFDDIVKFAEMEEFIDTPVKRYSSGMYVKLAFAVAAHLDSEIMVMDEVLAVGDMKFQQKCLGKMDDVSKSDGRTILYVSHNMSTIRQLCTRCIVLNHGKIIFDGDVEEAISIYMGEAGLSDSIVNLDEIDRGSFGIDNLVRMKKLELVDAENPIYKFNDKIKLRLHFFAKRDMDSLCIRVPVFYADNTIVGMATTKPISNCSKGDNAIELELDLPGLADGKYYLRFVAYSVGEMGGTTTHDVVNNALTFEIESMSSDANNILWEHAYWGSISFPNIETMEVACSSDKDEEKQTN